MNQIPHVVIACRIFQNLLEQHLPPDLAEQVTFLGYGLHSVSRKLKLAVQAELDALPEPSRVLLGYGLCGNGLKGVRAGLHTLVIPRADDCIAVLLGSYQAYREQFDAEPATYWLSKGWLESGSNPLIEYEQNLKKYGQEQADWIMDVQYRHYKRLAHVAHTPEDLEAYRAQAQEVGQYCQQWGMRYEEILGSDAYVKRMVSALFSKDGVGDDFLLILPGGEIQQSDFIR
jgi:hypothetical protein